MTKLMDDAVHALREVPPEFQDDIASTVIQIIGKKQPLYELTPEEEADIAASDAAAARGEFATDEQVRGIWAKHGL